MLKAASERGSLRVRGLADPIEKVARIPFLAVPGKDRVARAASRALLGGGLGVGALGLAGANMAAMEMLPEAAQAGSQIQGVAGEGRRRVDALAQAVADQEAGQARRASGVRSLLNAADPDVTTRSMFGKEIPRGDVAMSGLRGLVGGGAQEVAGAARARARLEDTQRYRETLRAAAEQRPTGDLPFSSLSANLLKTQSASPIEKEARHPFLAIPSKAKAARAALMGLGLGGAGLAAAAPGQFNAAVAEMAPEQAQLYRQLSEAQTQRVAADTAARRASGLKDQSESFTNRSRGLFDSGASLVSDAVEGSGGHFMSNRQDPIGLARGRERALFGLAGGLGTSAGLAGTGVGLAGEAATGAYSRRADRRNAGRAEALAAAQEALGHEKTQSANPAMEMVAFIRHQAKTAFPKLAYVANVQYRRAEHDDVEVDRLDKLARAEETLEAALDLNFLNPENISYFIGLQPKLNEVLDCLGRLLVAVRIGLPDVDEETVRSAMKKIDSILSGLRALSFAETDG